MKNISNSLFSVFLYRSLSIALLVTSMLLSCSSNDECETILGKYILSENSAKLTTKTYKIEKGELTIIAERCIDTSFTVTFSSLDFISENIVEIQNSNSQIESHYNITEECLHLAFPLNSTSALIRTLSFNISESCPNINSYFSFTNFSSRPTPNRQNFLIADYSCYENYYEGILDRVNNIIEANPFSYDTLFDVNNYELEYILQ